MLYGWFDIKLAKYNFVSIVVVFLLSIWRVLIILYDRKLWLILVFSSPNGSIVIIYDWIVFIRLTADLVSESLFLQNISFAWSKWPLSSLVKKFTTQQQQTDWSSYKRTKAERRSFNKLHKNKHCFWVRIKDRN